MDSDTFEEEFSELIKQGLLELDTTGKAFKITEKGHIQIALLEEKNPGSFLLMKYATLEELSSGKIKGVLLKTNI